MPRWLLYTVLTMLLWGGWGVVSKPVADALSAWQVQSLSTLGLLPVIVVLGFSRPQAQDTNRRRGFGLGLAAGLVCSAGNVAYFQALAIGGKAAAVIPFTSLYPLVTILLALILLGERLNRFQIGGIGASLLAVLCFNAGSGTAFLTPWLAVALAPVALWGTSALLQKLATRHASTQRISLGFLLGFIPLALAVPLFEPLPTNVGGATWLLLMFVGLFFGLGNLTLIAAYGSGGKAAIVTPLASLYSLVTIPLAMVFLAERLTLRESAGIALALAAVAALCRENPQPTGLEQPERA